MFLGISSDLSTQTQDIPFTAPTSVPTDPKEFGSGSVAATRIDVIHKSLHSELVSCETGHGHPVLPTSEEPLSAPRHPRPDRCPHRTAPRRAVRPAAEHRAPGALQRGGRFERGVCGGRRGAEARGETGGGEGSGYYKMV